MLALMALAIQFAVAFGHIHLPALWRAAPATVTAAITFDVDPAGPAGKHHPAADVFCDICATLNLTAAGAAPFAPVPAALAASFLLAPVQAGDDLALLEKRFLLAQSRAPPAV